MGYSLNNIIKKYNLQKGIISWTRNDKIGSGQIYADVKVSETHQFRNEITEQTMEDGSVVDEHVINKPIVISIQIYETNYTGNPASVFEKLVKIWEAKALLTLTTQHKIYQNMVISNMPITHRAPTKNSLSISCDMKQITFSKISTFQYVSKIKDVEMSASETVQGGPQQLQDIDPESSLAKLQ